MSAASALQPATGAGVTASPISPPAGVSSTAPTATPGAHVFPAAVTSNAVSPVPPGERWSVGVQVTARYPFAGTSPEDLPFQRKDVLTIVRQTKDPMWYRARNANGDEGMIPANYVRLKDDNAAADNSLPRGAKPAVENGVAPTTAIGGAPFKAAPSTVVNGSASPMSSNASVSESLNSTSSDGGVAANNPVDPAATSTSSSSNLPLIKSQQQPPSVVSPTSNNPQPNNVIPSAVSVKTNNDNNNSAPPVVGSSVRPTSPPEPMSRSNSDATGTDYSGSYKGPRL